MQKNSLFIILGMLGISSQAIALECKEGWQKGHIQTIPQIEPISNFPLSEIDQYKQYCQDSAQVTLSNYKNLFPEYAQGINGIVVSCYMGICTCSVGWVEKPTHDKRFHGSEWCEFQ